MYVSTYLHIPNTVQGRNEFLRNPMVQLPVHGHWMCLVYHEVARFHRSKNLCNNYEFKFKKKYIPLIAAVCSLLRKETIQMYHCLFILIQENSYLTITAHSESNYEKWHKFLTTMRRGIFIKFYKSQGRPTKSYGTT